MPKKHILYIMGVSGSGKSTVGKQLAKALDYPFFDGDDFHSEANIAKMASGKALNDSDRAEWLQSLNRLALKHQQNGAVIACSALKEAYRTILKSELHDSAQFVYLKGSFELIRSRLAQRAGHFMPLELLESQFETLEPPDSAIVVSIAHQPETMVADILKHLPS